ncbi:hypothetical protein CaCOL14_013202 [Colletotrichum acutatum]
MFNSIIFPNGLISSLRIFANSWCFAALHSYRFRELRHRLQSRWKVGAACAMGYRWTGGLRAATSSGLLQGPRHPGRLLHRHTRFTRQRQAQVGGRGYPTLRRRPHHPRRIEEGSPRRPRSD